MTKTKVLYNDDCPICSREIKHYDTLRAAGNLPLTFEPLAAHADDWGVSADDAARRIHARRGDEVLVGLPAFVAMWEEIPRYRWLARLCSLPVIRPLVHLLYEYILAPLLYRMHVRRQRKALTQRNN